MWSFATEVARQVAVAADYYWKRRNCLVTIKFMSLTEMNQANQPTSHLAVSNFVYFYSYNALKAFEKKKGPISTGKVRN